VLKNKFATLVDTRAMGEFVRVSRIDLFAHVGTAVSLFWSWWPLDSHACRFCKEPSRVQVTEMTKAARESFEESIKAYSEWIERLVAVTKNCVSGR
jgi:hypothetical protein